MEEPPKKPPETILYQQIGEAVEQVTRPTKGLFVSALSAGLDISISILLMITMLSFVRIDTLAGRALVSLMYSVGFIFVILGRSELFTEHTALLVMPWLDGRIGLRGMLRAWAVIWSANLVGVITFSWLVAHVLPSYGGAEAISIVVLSAELVHPAWWVILISAILAGWLMGLLSWTVTASRDTISQILLVVIVTFSIGFLQLHHSIIGSAEVLVGVFSDAGLTMLDYARFLLWSTIGNVIGGAVMVASIKYGHVISKDQS